MSGGAAAPADLDAAIRAALPEAAVLTAAPAPVASAWAADLARRRYGLRGRVEPLAGERDANFLLVDAASGARRVLKLSHPDEDPVVADFQTQALLHVARTDPGLPVQRLLPDVDGAVSSRLADAEGRPRVVRLFSYLEGLPMPQAPRSAAQRGSTARLLARLDRALAGLVHPAGERELPWDVQRADRVRPLLVHVADPARRALAEAALDDFARDVRPRLAGLRRQPIHNDFNLYNLLVDPAEPTRVAGILDFGDMVHAPLVNDLAVAVSYQIDAEEGALATLARFTADYHAVSPLSGAELRVLPGLVRARLAMVVAIGGWRAARQPGNADYLLRNNAVSWARLAACADLTADRVEAAIGAACRVPEPSHG
ncbi:phosphotransferase (plasmid) [Comamonadaceae bacterium OTU4NAUVB1]|nr:phosphotransferase [Comamonadaceae bacterium OTU4NAUVB1]